jgi:hypothetical protein
MEDSTLQPGILTDKIEYFSVDIKKEMITIGWKVIAFCSHSFNLKCFQNGSIKKCNFCKNREFKHIYLNNKKISLLQ